MAEIGLIASVLQVADIGARLSVKIYNLCRTAVNADDSITFISKDISHTSAILIEVGRCLEKDHEAQLCSENAFRTTSAIVDECRTVFEDLDQALMDKMTRMGLDGKPGQPESAILERSTWPFLQPRMKLLWNNLDKLKSTLHLMLIVLIYARQVAEKIAPMPAVNQQRVIIEHLLRLISEQAQKHENLKVMMKERNLEIVREVRALAKNGPPASPPRSSPAPTDSSSSGTIGHYCDLIDNLLACVDFEDYSVDSEVRTRIRNDVVEVHKRETRYLAGIYGAEDLKDAMRGKSWKLADMEGESYPLTRAMRNQSLSSLSELAEKTAALEVVKVAETTETKPSDTKTSNTCPGDSISGGPKEVGTETSPQLLKKEANPLREAPSGPEVSITRLSAIPKRLSSERLEAVDSTKSVPGNRSHPDGATREHSECADTYHKGQQRKIATAEKLDNRAVKILDQDTEYSEELLEEVNSETILIPLSQPGISKRPARGGVGYVKKTYPFRRASIPLHNAHRKKPNPKFKSFIHSGAAPLPHHAKSRELAVPLKEVVEVPQQAVNFKPPTANAQSLPPNYAMEAFLNDRWENPVTQKEASDAGMPAPARHEATSPDDSETSVMVTQRSRTRESVSTSQDLPALTISSKSSASSQGGTSLAEDSDTDAVTIVAPDWDSLADDAVGTLECPFNQSGCLQTFADSKEWITHSLTHFGSVGPPTTNRCTFCEEQFHSFDAAQSWSERMNHVALHHRLGNKLTGARWDNTVYLYTHMYEKGLLDINFLCEYLGRERDRRSVISVVNSGA
ncbi:hypothetical protein JMJ35_006426 [Cladonia borealis]|uniref:Uncharacterized protein n=1 Tax=Cladonia borealis TaxID=184061 RepID=A0AA39QZK5_9LECA|nr:hypothetical protein JMJ35_006426 [Cladonia borealis]